MLLIWVCCAAVWAVPSLSLSLLVLRTALSSCLEPQSLFPWNAASPSSLKFFSSHRSSRKIHPPWQGLPAVPLPRLSLLCPFRVEHPAGGYKKLFETVEELSSPVTAHVTGWSGASSPAALLCSCSSGAPRLHKELLIRATETSAWVGNSSDISVLNVSVYTS